MIRIIFISLPLIIANFLFGCKSKESLPATVSSDSLKVEKREKVIKPPSWVNVVSNKGDTLQIAQIADFGMGCPRAGDVDVDGRYTEGCPQRGILISAMIEFSNSIFSKKVWEGHFEYNNKEMIGCNQQIHASYLVFIADSFLVFDFYEYFDSIQVRYQNEVAYLNFKGYVNPENRGYPKSKGEDGIDGDGMADAPETILILKTKQRLNKIVMTSPSGVIRGDYLVKDHTLIPVSKKSLWPCKPAISIR